MIFEELPGVAHTLGIFSLRILAVDIRLFGAGFQHSRSQLLIIHDSVKITAKKKG